MIIRSFGKIQEILPSEINITEKLTTSSKLMEFLEEKYPTLKDVKFQIAVNREIISSETDLDSNSEIALLPPFSGG